MDASRFREKDKISHYIINRIENGGVTRYKIGDQDFPNLQALLRFYQHHFLDQSNLTRPVSTVLFPTTQISCSISSRCAVFFVVFPGRNGSDVLLCGCLAKSGITCGCWTSGDDSWTANMSTSPHWCDLLNRNVVSTHGRCARVELQIGYEVFESVFFSLYFLSL